MAARIIKRNKEGWITSYDGVKVYPIHSLLDHTPATHRPFKSLLPPILKYAINLKGTNGSGKSNIPIYMIKTEGPDDAVVYLTLSKTDKRPVATYCKTYDTVILGLYLTNCGGCDSLGNTQIVKLLLAKLWKKDVHILFEGVIVGDIRSTFYELMKDFNTVYKREISFCFMGTRLKECFRRIRLRNGNKPFNEQMVRAKYVNSMNHLNYYLAQGDVNCTVLNTKMSRQDTFYEFLGLYPELNPIF